MRILIVDDNRDSADTLAMVLEFEGHQVAAAYSARDALARLDDWRTDAVLLDLGLPEMNGYEVARRIRARPDGAGVRLVALTGYGQAEDRERTREAGFDGHLVKPVEFEAVARALAGSP